MKKLFCDCCGNEFNPATDAQRTAIGGGEIRTTMTATANAPTPGTVYNFSGRISVTPVNTDGSSAPVDVCGPCMWLIVNKMKPA